MSIPEREIQLPGQDSAGVDKKTNSWKSSHFAIIISNNAKFNGDNENIYAMKISQFFQDKNILCYSFTNRTSAQTMEDINIIFDRHKNISNCWLVFIGSAIEYGPVAADNRCLNLRRILASREQQNNHTFLTIFACPHHNPSLVVHDAIDDSGAATFSDLQPNSNYAALFDDIKNVQENMQREVLDQLNSSVNYFFTSVPVSVVDENDKNKSMLDYFIDRFDVKGIGNIQLKETLEGIHSDLRRSTLNSSLLPVYRCDNNSNLI